MKLSDRISNLLDIFFQFLPVSKNRVLFSSFHGQYNDNPKYISVEMHKQYPSITQYWVFSEKTNANDIPYYIRPLKYNTLKYNIIKNTCCLFIENGAGAYLFDNSTSFFWLKKKLKNRKQIDFSTWHGNPIKHIGAQIPGNEFWDKNTFFTSSDVMIAGCQLVKSIFEDAFLNSMPVKLLGTPRTDLLFNNDSKQVLNLKKKLGLPIDKKIVLYAPTYRNDPNNSGVDQMNTFDFPQLFSALHNRFGGEWAFVFRVHNMVLLNIDVEKLVNKYPNTVINGNKYDDMAEYLAAADVLISDYSGCVYDIALTEKPCFLYALDRDNYENEERGVYFPVEKFPYTFAESFNQLLNDIQNYSAEQTAVQREQFLRFIGNIEDGNASKRVVKYLSDIFCKNPIN